MPKPLKKRRGEETDPSEWAHDMVQRSTAEPSQDERDQPEEFRSQLSAYMSKLGQKGGKVQRGAPHGEPDPGEAERDRPEGGSSALGQEGRQEKVGAALTEPLHTALERFSLAADGTVLAILMLGDGPLLGQPAKAHCYHPDIDM